MDHQTRARWRTRAVNALLLVACAWALWDGWHA